MIDDSSQSSESPDRPSPSSAVKVPAAKAPKAADGYMVQLDGLRAIAVLAVIFSHAGPLALAHGLETGPLGVRLFFVLSGFLITGILLRARPDVRQIARANRDGSSDAPATPATADAARGARGQVIRAFYARRFLRIFPLYYAVLFAITLLGLPEARETFWWNLLYLSNYYSALHGTWPGAVSHFWSLAVEEQFYLIWPWLMLLTPLRRLPWLLGLTMLLGPVSRFAIARITDSNLIAVSTPMIACLDTLGAGAVLAWLWHAPQAAAWLGPTPDARARRVTQLTHVALAAGLLCGAGLALCYALDAGWMLRLSLWDLAVSLIFVSIVHHAARGLRGFPGRLLSSRPLVYLGTISYGIYVYHAFVEPAVNGLSALLGVHIPFPADGGALRFTLVTVLTVAMAALSWHAFERPLNALKSRFAYTGPSGRPRETATRAPAST